MVFYPIQCFEDFIVSLRQAGFSMASNSNDEGIFSLGSFFDTNIIWHTDDPDTDPWLWRIRVLDECRDIAYSKLFLKKHGYLTRSWYSSFMALRRPVSLEEAYREGRISAESRTIYQLVNEHGSLSVHDLKSRYGISKEHNLAFSNALDSLQMLMYITMCGTEHKISRNGEPYGWPSACYCLPEKLFGSDLLAEAAEIDPQQALSDITQQILKLNPNASAKAVQRFLKA